MYIYIYIYIYIYFYRSLGGERCRKKCWPAPPRPGNRFVSFVRACVRPTRGFLSYVVSAQKVSLGLRIFYFLSRLVSFLFVVVVLPAQVWIFHLGSYLLSLEILSFGFWSFLKRVLEESS